MYKIGELVQYGNSGVCRVEEIVTGIPGLDKNTVFYLLIPIHGNGGKIYSPVDSDKVKMRCVLSAKEVRLLLGTAGELPELQIENEKQCEGIYKEALYSVDCGHWLRLLKTLCSRRELRSRQGKKVTATDERYFRHVEDRLREEWSITIGEEEASRELEQTELLFATLNNGKDE